MLNAYARFLNNRVFVNLILAGVLALGAMATISIRRESNPDITVNMLQASVVYPGGDPEEVDEAITRKIAAEIDGLRGVKRYWTESGEGYGSVEIEVAEGYDVDEVKDRVQNAVDSIDTFPARAETPRVRRFLDNDGAGSVVVWGDLPERQLKELASRVHREIQDLPEVSVIYLNDTRDFQISVEVSRDALDQFGLTLSDVSHAIRQSSLNEAAGTLHLDTEDMRIRTLGRRYAGPEFASIVVKSEPDGSTVTLGQIARITDRFEEYERFATFNGQPCVLMDVMRAPGEDLIKIDDALREYVAEKQASLPDGAHLEKVFSSTRYVETQMRMLSVNGLFGLGLVLIVLWLFLESRLAFWVAMGIPISLAGAVLILWLIGGTLNQISLVGLIVVLGIVVDDAIVVGESVFYHRRIGKPPLLAAVDGVREVALPVVASVTTTILAFLPMAFIGGTFGQFMVEMPLVIVTALVVSLLECIFLLPAHLNHRAKREGQTPSRWNPERIQHWVSHGMDRFVERRYLPLVRWCVRRRYLTACMGASLLLLTLGVIGSGMVPLTVWPGVQGDHLRAYVEFPPGTPTRVVWQGLRETEAALYRVADRYTTRAGGPLVENVYTRAPHEHASHGRILVQLATASERDVTADEFMVAWQQETPKIAGAILQSFEGERIGDSGATDVSIWLQGEELDPLRTASEELKARLARYDGIYQIEDNFRSGKGEIQLTLKPAAHALGLTLDGVSQQLYARYHGEEAVTLLRGREEVEVRVRLPREERASLGGLDALRVRTPSGKSVPLRSIADVTLAQGVSSISGINGKRGINIRAAVDRNKAVPAEINADFLENHVPEVLAKYPGVTWSLAGAEEENRQMLADLSRNSMVAALAIFVVLCTMFRSYLQPLIIMAVIPYGLVGAVAGHLVLGLPLSILSIAGIVALVGVMVNDSIVLIDRVNAFLNEGQPFEEALCLAGQRRFRAIFLTSVSTCVGLGPLIAESDLMAQIVIPMAVSLAGGVAIGTMLTLVFIPAYVGILNDGRRVVARIVRGNWPSAEEVEPAVQSRITQDLMSAEAG